MRVAPSDQIEIESKNSEYHVEPKEDPNLNWDNYNEDLPTLYGVTIRPMDPLDLSFHSHSSNNPLDVSFHKTFRGKPILKANRSKISAVDAEEIQVDSEVTVQQKRLENISIESDTTTSLPRIRKNSGKSVSWNVLHIREYDITIGDNPCVSYGPPISLDWCYMNMGTIKVEEYESNRRPRRSMRQMMMNYYYRRNLLIYACGETAEGLKKATKKIKKIRLRRAITNALPLPIQFIEDVTESAIRKTRRVLNKKERRGCDI